jgi:hypothetical protein
MTSVHSDPDHGVPTPDHARASVSGPSPVVAVLALSAAALIASVAFARDLSPGDVSGTLQAEWVLSAVAIGFGVVALTWGSGSIPGIRPPGRRAGEAVTLLQMASFLSAAALLVVVGFELPGTTIGTPAPVESAGTTTTTSPTAPGAPVILGVRPGAARVGARVVVRGSGFIGVARVVFAGGTAPVTAETATRIVTHVPPGARTGTISVSTSLGTGHSPGAFRVAG